MKPMNNVQRLAFKSIDFYQKIKMENDIKKFIVYLTVNTQNNKIYIGVHKTNPNIFDYYYGNGIYSNMPSTYRKPKTNFGSAIKKYGFGKFKRYTIGVYDTEEEALLVEQLLVDNKFVNRNDTYNQTTGGIHSLKFEIPIYQFDLNGEFIAKYKSAKVASESVGANTSSALISAYKTKTSYLNFLWSTEPEINLADFKITTFCKTVYKFDRYCNLINVFSSLSQAALDADVSSEQIKNAIYKQTAINKFYYSYNERISLHVDLQRIVFRYDLNGNFVDSDCLENFCESFSLTPLRLHKVASSGLCIRNFQWNFENPLKMHDITSRVGKGAKRKVGQYTKEGELVRVFESVKSCRKEFTNVGRCLSGKVDMAKGFVFKYIE